MRVIDKHQSRAATVAAKLRQARLRLAQDRQDSLQTGASVAPSDRPRLVVQQTMSVVTQRTVRLENLRSQVQRGEYRVDVGALADALLKAIQGKSVSQMPLLLHETNSTYVATLLHALRAETEAYDRFTLSLRALRSLFVDNRIQEAREACDGLLKLARDLQARAQERVRLCDLKLGRPCAEEETGADRAAIEGAYGSLFQAQLRARTELTVSMEILCDLRAHTATLRATLEGQTTVLYDSRGRALRPGG